MLSAPFSTPAETNLGATIHIGREIRCPQYAEFLINSVENIKRNMFNVYFNVVLMISGCFLTKLCIIYKKVVQGVLT